MRTKVFKSGNSKAVRLPADIAFDVGTELEITRTGDVVTLYPARSASLKEALEYLQNNPPPVPLGPIERTQTRMTKWDLEAEETERAFAEDASVFAKGSKSGKDGA